MKHLFSNWLAEYKKRLSELQAADSAVFNDLASGSQQLSVANYYATKCVGAVSSYNDLFKSDDDISVGMTNISSGKPQAGDRFLLCGISVQYVTAAGTAAANTKAAAFGLINTNMRNGEIEISQNKRMILEKQLMEPFYTSEQVYATADTNPALGTPSAATIAGFGNIGFYELPTPKWIEPERKIDVAMDFAAAMGSANASVRIILWGIKNVKV